MEMEQGDLFNSTFEDFGDTKSHQENGIFFTANRLEHTAELLDYYYTPILCFFGAMGNCLSVTVFCSNANHRSLSSSYYLSALAISDTGFLINLFAVWLDGMGVGILATNFGCPFVMYSGQVTCFLSVWLTVAFTVERFFAVYSPLLRPVYCTVSKAKKVIFGLTTFALIAFSYVIFIAKVKQIYNHDHVDLAYKDRPNSTEGNLIVHFTPPLSGGTTTKASNKFSNTLREKKECLLSFPVNENCTRAGKNNREEILDIDGDSDYISTELNTLPKGMAFGPTFADSGYSIPLWINNSEMNLTKRIANEGEINLSQSDIIGNIPHQQMNLRCTVPFEYMTISTVANYLDSMITLIIPFCLITFFNMRIAVCIWKLKDQRMNIIAHAKISNKKSGKSSRGIREHFNKIIRREVCQPKNNDEYGDGGVKPSSNVESPGLYSFGSIIPKPTTSTRTLDLREDDMDENEHFLGKNQLSVNPNNDNSNQSSSPKLRDGIPLSAKDVSSKKSSNVNDEVVIIDHETVRFQNHSTCESLRPQSVPNFVDSANEIGNGHKKGFQKRGGGCSTTTSSYSASEYRVTKMLLLVSTVFIVLNLPSHAIRAASFIQNLLWEDDFEGRRWLFAANQISNILLFNTNFAVNFLLYCLSGRNFRKSLWTIVFKRFIVKLSYWTSRKSTVAVPKSARFGSRRNNDNESATFDEHTCVQ